jgi:threonylcarbamoyladenosine tRNA methylthiotransferase MtaB
MIDQSAREIVLTGVNIGRYDHDDVSFTRLLADLLELPGNYRIRISSIEPDAWEGGFLPHVGHPKLCPHLHLCLQSGSEKILRLMRRQYTVSGFLEFVYAIKKRQPEFNFTTDIMVGFPGETVEDFLASCGVAREVGFSHIHTFPYSQRHGTPAEGMPQQIPSKVKTERARAIRGISDHYKRGYRESLIGKNQTVLIERVSNGKAYGYGQHYVPVVVPADARVVIGEFYPTRVKSVSADDELRLIGSRQGKSI